MQTDPGMIGWLRLMKRTEAEAERARPVAGLECAWLSGERER
jgi:hypothetical protein